VQEFVRDDVLRELWREDARVDRHPARRRVGREVGLDVREQPWSGRLDVQDPDVDLPVAVVERGWIAPGRDVGRVGALGTGREVAGLLPVDPGEVRRGGQLTREVDLEMIGLEQLGKGRQGPQRRPGSQSGAGGETEAAADERNEKKPTKGHRSTLIGRSKPKL
jgi:hypothetical protein